MSAHTTRRRAIRPFTAPGPRPGSSPGVVTRTNGRNGTGRDVPEAKATEALLRRPPAKVARTANDGIWVRCGFVELGHFAPASAAPPFACRCGSAAAFGSLLAARPTDRPGRRVPRDALVRAAGETVVVVSGPRGSVCGLEAIARGKASPTASRSSSTATCGRRRPGPIWSGRGRAGEASAPNFAVAAPPRQDLASSTVTRRA